MDDVIINGILLAVYICIFLTGIVNKLPFSKEINEKLPDNLAFPEKTDEDLQSTEDWVSKYYGVLWTIAGLTLLYSNYKSLSKNNFSSVPSLVISLVGAALGLLTGHYTRILNIVEKVIPLGHLSKSKKVSLVNVILALVALINLGFSTGYLSFNKTTLITLATSFISAVVGWGIRYYYLGRYSEEGRVKCALRLEDTEKRMKENVDGLQVKLDECLNAEQPTVPAEPEVVDTTPKTSEVEPFVNYSMFA